MEDLMFMAMAFEHDQLLLEAAQAVKEGMDIEDAARDFGIDLKELEAHCRKY